MEITPHSALSLGPEAGAPYPLTSVHSISKPLEMISWAALEVLSVGSLFRRGLARLGEVIGVGEILDAGHLCNFHAEFFGPNVFGYTLVFMGLSLLFDLADLVTRPPPCQRDDPQLPL